MPSSTTRTLFTSVGLLVLVGAIGTGLWLASQPAPQLLQGQMEARETLVAPKVTARVAEVLVREGDTVQPGTLLVRLDSPEVQAKLAQAQAAQAAAQAQAAKAERGARPQEIEMARLNWQRAQASAELARTSYERVERLAREGLVAEQKRDEARTQYVAARDQALAAKSQYDLARDGARSEDREAASAQAQQVAGLVAEVEAAQAETTLRSPVGGEVAKVQARVGELSPQGAAVVTVVDLADQWAVFNVREDRLQRFAVGAEFEARLPALPDQTVRFKVEHVAALPDFATWRATRSDQGFDVRTFEVKARPVQPVAGARPGMSVLVD